MSEWEKKEQCLEIQRTVTVTYKVPLSAYPEHNGRLAKAYEEARDVQDKVEEMANLLAYPDIGGSVAQIQFSEAIVIED